jgi:HlyD family secretion protein
MLRRTILFVLLGSIGAFGARKYWMSDAQAAPKIAVAVVTAGPVAEEVSATGTLQAVTAVQVGSQVSGIISWLGADYNSIVKKGQVIARLEPSLAQAQVEQSRAALAKAIAESDNARASLSNADLKNSRMQALLEKGVISKSDADAAALALSVAQAQVKTTDAQVLQARAALEQNQNNLARTVITSPIDGIVIQRSVDVGQTVSASMSSPTLFVIAADLSAMQVKAGLDESDIGRIRPGQRVTFQVDAYRNQSFEGVVRQVRLEPSLTQNVVTYDVIIDARNPQFQLKPGMTANVKIQIARAEQAVRIPNAALRFRPTDEMFAMLGQPVPDGSRRTAGTSGSAADAVRAVDVRDNASSAPEVVLARNETIDKGADVPQTVDALFAPLPPAESTGRVWVNRNGQLVPVSVRVGITDGQTSALIEGDLQPGDELVTNVTTAEAAVRSTAQPTGGIFMSVPGGPGSRRIG